MTTDAVADVADATFDVDVLERSHTLPVVVDFWAPWCGPCRVIGPVLEQLAEEYAGRIQLVKLNVDENPQVSARYGIRSIPAVKAFRDGKQAAEFLGAVPEAQARRFFESLLPSEADRAVAEARQARAAGDLAAARERCEAALASDVRHRAAAVMLAEVELEAGNLDHAHELASRWTEDAVARRVLALVGFRHAAEGADRVALEARLAAGEADAAAHYALGCALAAEGEWEPALEHLLATVRLDRRLDDDGGRRRMLEVFEVLGDAHPLTAEYRQRLASVLF